MTTRREFFKKGGTALAAVTLAGHPAFSATSKVKEEYVTNRPPLDKRRFTSKAVEKLIASTKKK